MRGDLPRNSFIECSTVDGDEVVQCELKVKDRNGEVTRKAYVKAAAVNGSLKPLEVKGEESFLDSLFRYMKKRIALEED